MTRWIGSHNEMREDKDLAEPAGVVDQRDAVLAAVDDDKHVGSATPPESSVEREGILDQHGAVLEPLEPIGGDAAERW